MPRLILRQWGGEKSAPDVAEGMRNVKMIRFCLRALHSWRKQNLCAHPCRLGRIDVQLLVTDENARRQIQAEICPRPQEHPGIGLSKRRVRLVSADAMDGVIGAIVHARNIYRLLGKPVEHPFRQFQENRLRKVAPRDTGLVCYHQQVIIAGLRRPAQVENALLKLELLPRMHIRVIDIDNPVPVQEECFVLAHIWRGPRGRFLLCPMPNPHNLKITGGIPRGGRPRATQRLPRGEGSGDLGCHRLLDGIAERVTHQDVALLNARRLVRGHSDQRLHEAAQFAAGGAG